MASSELAVILTILAFGLVLYTISTKNKAVSAHLPPGPKPIPLLGNVHQLPAEYQEKAFAEWGKKYGSLIYAKIFRTSALIINSVDVARDLMDKRSPNYSDRPRFVLLNELLGWDSTLAPMPYTPQYRKQRKWVQDAFLVKSALASYRPIQHREASICLAGLLTTPGAFKDHFARFAAATIMEIAYGHRVTSNDDSYVRMAQEATLETALAGSPGSMLADFFPILKQIPTWMPGSGFKANALRVRGLIRQVLDIPYNKVKANMEAGTAGPSIASVLIEKSFRNGTLKDDEEDIKGAAGGLYGAGTESTTTMLATFIMAMLRHPEVFEKAQAEVDRVVGSDRLPDFDDRPSLPYLEAVLIELYRYHTPIPLGVPHKVTADDEYHGFHLPAGSMVIANIWAMSQVEEYYPEPDHFRPERFLGIDKATMDTIDPRNYVFGFGRRVCPGRDFADIGIFLVMSQILATMDIRRAKDENGKEIIPAFEFTSGFATHPKPFTCEIRPRSRKVVNLVSQMNIGNDFVDIPNSIL